jgi:cysteinyl-tRNA synthetase
MSKGQRAGVLYVRNIPTDIKNFFKAYCDKRGLSMREVILRFMRESVRDDNKLRIQQRE